MGMGMGMGAAPMPGASMDPMMGGGMPPQMGMPAPPDMTDTMIQQLQLLFQKWGAGEMQIAGEKGALSDMLMMLLTSTQPNAAQAFAEPGMGQSMVGAPMDDVGGLPMDPATGGMMGGPGY